MKKMNQKGFSVVEVVLIIVVLVLIGGIGYRLVNGRKNDTPSTNSNTATKPETPKSETNTEKPDETKDWLRYTSQNKKFTVSVPDGWSLIETKGEKDNLISFDAKDVTYTPGTRGKVEVIDGGRDFASVSFYLVYDYQTNQYAYQSPDLKQVSTYTTKSGAKVVKSSRTQTKQPEGMDIPVGTVEYTYDVTQNGKNVHITHDILTGEADQTSRIEQLIETVQFL